MEKSSFHDEPLQELLIALTDGEMDAAQFAELEKLLLNDPAAQAYYRRYMRLCALLEFEHAAAAGAGDAPNAAGKAENGFPNVLPDIIPPSIPPIAPSAPQISGKGKWDFDLPPEKPRPKVVIETSPPSPIPWYSVNSPIGLPLISYSLGAIIMLIAIGIGAVVHISHSHEIPAGQAATSEDAGGGSGSGGGLSGSLATAEKAKPKKEEAPVVGHISGMVGCRWADPSLKSVAPRIRQGTKFALASGLMEITYTTGAKVILQSPCTYEVESSSGGYLSLGKLTARVASGQWPVASAHSPAEIPKSAISKSPNSSCEPRPPSSPTSARSSGWKWARMPVLLRTSFKAGY